MLWSCFFCYVISLDVKSCGYFSRKLASASDITFQLLLSLYLDTPSRTIRHRSIYSQMKRYSLMIDYFTGSWVDVSFVNFCWFLFKWIKLWMRILCNKNNVSSVFSNYSGKLGKPRNQMSEDLISFPRNTTVYELFLRIRVSSTKFSSVVWIFICVLVWESRG